MKLKLSDWIVPAFFVICAVFGVYKMTSAFAASAPMESVPLAQSANLARPCNVQGQTTQTVSVTASSAATSSATVQGNVRIICTNAAYMIMSAAGAAAPTATTSDVYLGQLLPEYFYSPGGKVAFLRVAADGSCYVTDCK